MKFRIYRNKKWEDTLTENEDIDALMDKCKDILNNTASDISKVQLLNNNDEISFECSKQDDWNHVVDFAKNFNLKRRTK